MPNNLSQTGPRWLSAKAALCVLPLLIAACSHRVDDCKYTLTCGDFSVGGTTGNEAGVNTGGTLGTGGDSSLGGTSALSGGSGLGGIGITSSAGDIGGSNDTGGAGTTGGDADVNTGGTLGTGGDGSMGGINALGGITGLGGIAGTGGGGGTGGGVITCNPVCQVQKPVCLEASKTCVECTGDQHCWGSKPHCDSTKHTCVECVGDEQCSGTKPHCDSARNICVECAGDGHCSGSKPYCDLGLSICAECLDSADCTSPAASLCIAGTCTHCESNSDCAHIPGKGVCDTKAIQTDAGTDTGTCVECTGTDYAACSSGDAGPAQVCNSLLKTCTDFDERSATVCEPCVSDAQCEPGKLCVEEKFNNVSVGYFCSFNQDYATNGVTQSCASLSPYVKYINGAVSIDGRTANICGLAASTCTAMNLYRKEKCALTGTPDDSLCGVAPGLDSKCLPWVSGSSAPYYCTVACVTSVDCKYGLPCKPLVDSTKTFCAFQ